MQSDHSPKPGRPKSREVSSRFLSPSSETHDISSPRRVHSPLRQKQSAAASDHKHSTARRLWPSSGENSNNPSSINRQNSCTDLSSRFDKKLNRTEMLKPVLGGSMRCAKERILSWRDSNSCLPYQLPLEDQTVILGRRSIDENMLHRKSMFGRISESTSDATQDSEPDSSDLNYRFDSPVTRRSGIEVASKYLQSTTTTTSNKLALKSTIKRSKSINAMTKWSLSPGRSALSSMKVESKERPISVSSMKPPTSPSKRKGMGNLLISKGLELFKVKKSTSSSAHSPSSSSNVAFISGPGVGDSVHHLRLLNNRLVGWRYVNAKSEATVRTVANQAEMKLIQASGSLFKLQQSVMQKRSQLAKEKMEMKINYVLHSQIRLLECWGNIERQHISSISKIIESLHSVVCKLPLVEGATLDKNSATINLRQASDISTSIMSLISTFSHEAEKTAPILWELARVVTEEKFLFDEFLELYWAISMLKAQEQSLRCNLIQMKSHQ